MKKFTLFVICCLVSFNMSAQWQTLSRTKDGGGEIPEKVNFMAIDNGKLYAATTDGIWESASMNGGDWKPFGLQGEEVLIMNFGTYKLAVINTTSVDFNKDGTPATAGQLYKLSDDGSTWELTRFNEGKKKNFRPTTGFVQVKDDQGQQVIVIPTWGDGIWRSEDGGDSWTCCDLLEDTFDPSLLICKTVVGLFTFPNDPVIYGTDKAGNNDNYLIRSHDYGKTWEYAWVGSFFNPWAFCKRWVNGVETFYFGGENGSGGYTVMRSINGGAEGTWDICATTDESGGYWNNRYMLGVDDGPLFVMLAHRGVFLYKDEDATLECLGTDLQITDPNNQSLTHLAMTDKNLYCSSQKNFIQVYDISSLTSSSGIDETHQPLCALNVMQDKVYVPADANSSVAIYNMGGMLVKNVVSEGSVLTIDLSTLSCGVYLLQYEQDGTLVTEKIIKQ